jgi:hypothetical protein
MLILHQNPRKQTQVGYHAKKNSLIRVDAELDKALKIGAER